MDFFDRQARALKNSKLLVLYFILGVGLMILAVYCALVVVFWIAETSPEQGRRLTNLSLWQPQLFMWSGLGTLAVVGFGSLYKIVELSRGGRAVAEMLGGTLVHSHTRDPDERRLLNVVEEMALAAGVPVPQVYVLRGEKGINAFAAGHNTGDAVVGVTDGTLRLLTRDELQGVIAHEFSHILYGDMRLNLRLMGILFGILCLTILGRMMLYTRSGGNRGKNPLPLLGLAFLAIGGVGFLFGRLIQAAVSRQREYLADASAVQFTRNPDGLAAALKKIGGLTHGARLTAPQAGEASHMFFGDAMGASWFATHPPLVERIRAIDPSFDGVFPRVSTPGVQSRLPGQRYPQGQSRPQANSASAAAGVSALAVPPVIVVPNVPEHVGAPGSYQVRYAHELRDAFPPVLRVAASEPLGACAIVYGLLISDEEAVRKRQLEWLTANATNAEVQETIHILPEVRQMARRARLPLVDLAMPQLRELAPAQYFRFREAVKALTEADEQIDLFEYVLQKVVVRHLEPNFVRVRRAIAQYHHLRSLAGECAVLLSALAYSGHGTPEEVQVAFESGAEVLRSEDSMQVRLVPGAHCGLREIDVALNRLAQTASPLKKVLLSACAHTVATDNVIQEAEWELLRVISDTLDCPLPIRINEHTAAEQPVS